MTYKVCYSVKTSGGAWREMPPAQNIATLELAKEHAEKLVGFGYRISSISPESW